MSLEMVVGERLDGSGGPAELMEVAKSSVWRINVLLGGEIMGHGSVFAYKQVIDRANGMSRIFMLTNLHNFNLPIAELYGEMLRRARLQAPAEALVASSEVVIGTNRCTVSNVIAAKGAMFSHNRPKFQDFAIVEISVPTVDGLRMFALPTSEDARDGDAVYALGYPHTTDLGITDGIVSRVYRSDASDEAHLWQIQHSVMINGGNSGGPTVNRFGVAVGISTWGWFGKPGLNFSVDVSHVLSLVADREEVEVVDVNSMFGRLTARAMEEARYGR